MLQVNPKDRPTIHDVVERLEEIGQARQIKLTEALPFVQKSEGSGLSNLCIKFFSILHKFSEIYSNGY